MDDLPTPQPPTQQVKLSFHHLCLMYELDDKALQDIADISGVDKSIIDAMFVNLLVHRADALKALAALSQYTGKTWSFDNVKIALLPTFQELHTAHHFNLAKLAMHAGVPFTTLNKMLNDHPVPLRDARLVLQMASRLSGQNYTLKNVDVQLTDGNLERGGIALRR